MVRTTRRVGNRSCRDLLDSYRSEETGCLVLDMRMRDMDRVKGRIKEAAGELTGNDRLRD